MPMPIDSPTTVAHRGHADPARAALLLGAVVEARAAVARERRLPRGGEGLEARVTLLATLESYASLLAEQGCPIPYAMRDELRIQRLMSAPRRG